MFRVPKKEFAVTFRGRLMLNGKNGWFAFPSPIPGRILFAIASDGSEWTKAGLPGEPWEHVSVHAEQGKRKEKTPVWPEMCFVKNLFWDKEDSVIQFHPPE